MVGTGDTSANAYRQRRIVLLSGTLRLSGSSTWIVALQGALRQLGCPVIHIVVGEPGEVELPDCYAVHYTGRARRHPLLRVCRLLQLHKLLPAWFAGKSDQIAGARIADIMRGYGWQDGIDLVIKDFTSDTPGYFLDCLVVSVIHQMLSPVWADPKMRSRVEPSFLLAAVSLAVAEDARRLHLDVPHILYNPLDIAVLRARATAFEVDENYLVYVGSLHRDKGVYELVEAYARARPALPLWIVGSGGEREGLERRARELDIAERVRFLGFQPNPYPYIAGARLLVLPSRSEAMGYVCLEAAALNTPFIVSDYPAAREFFKPAALVCLQPAESFVDRLAGRLSEALQCLDPPAVLEGVMERLAPVAVAKSYLELIP